MLLFKFLLCHFSAETLDKFLNFSEPVSSGTLCVCPREEDFNQGRGIEGEDFINECIRSTKWKKSIKSSRIT